MPRSLADLVPPFVALALVLPACGGSTFSNGSDPSGGSASAGTTGGGGTDGGTGSGGGNQGGAATGGKAQGGSHSGGAATGGSSAGGTGSGGSSQCDAFLDEPGPMVAVRIINQTKLPIYLGPQMHGCGVPLFDVVDAAGDALPAPGFCSPRCEQIIHDAISSCPPILCPIGATITLQPGESRIQQWSGVFLVSTTLPAACRPAAGTSECARVAGVKPGVFTFSSQAGTELDCSQLGGGTCQACMPDGSGGCATPGALISGPLLSAEITVNLDGSYGVGGSGGGGMARAVELVFTR